MYSKNKYFIFAVLLTSMTLFANRISAQIFEIKNSEAQPKQKNYANLAKKLAKDVYNAKSDQKRYSAILRIMKALKVGVYTTKGKAITRGPERGAADFYLYDFELHSIATGLKHGKTWSLQNLSDQLNKMNITGELVKLGFSPVAETTPELLKNALTDGISSSAQQPTKSGALLPLLVQQLGLKRSPAVDISKPLSIDQVTFDSLQYFLVLTDILSPFLYDSSKTRGDLAAGHVSSTSATFESTGKSFDNIGSKLGENYDLPMLSKEAEIVKAGGPCSFIGNEGTWNLLTLGNKYLIGKLGVAVFSKKVRAAISVAEKRAAIADIIIMGIHGSLLQFAIDVQETKSSKDNNKTHIGPKEAGHVGRAVEPGTRMVLQLGVQMLKDFTDWPELIACGKLVDMQIPKPGPIPGITIRWGGSLYDFDINHIDRLKSHGQIIQMDNETDENGLASLVFEPNNELDETRPIRSSTEKIYEIHDVVTPVVALVSSLGGSNVLGAFTDFIIPRQITIPYLIEEHRGKQFVLKMSGSADGCKWSKVANTALNCNNGNSAFSLIGEFAMDAAGMISGRYSTDFNGVEEFNLLGDNPCNRTWSSYGTGAISGERDTIHGNLFRINLAPDHGNPSGWFPASSTGGGSGCPIDVGLVASSVLHLFNCVTKLEGGSFFFTDKPEILDYSSVIKSSCDLQGVYANFQYELIPQY